MEIIINNLLDMGRYQSIKMFDYGVFFAKKENK
nr:MAG TPA: Cyclic dimeric GMP binding protein [Caudoviricetes sp.]